MIIRKIPDYRGLILLSLIMITISLFILPQNLSAGEDNMTGLLPVEMKEKGFTTSYKHRVYDDTNLYDYLDGGAPFYLERGFEELITDEYVKDGDSYMIDIYRMKNAKSALKLLSDMKKPGLPKPAFGDDGQEGKNQTEFIRGKYLVRITAFKTDSKTLANIKELGKAVDLHIQNNEKGNK